MTGGIFYGLVGK